MPFKFHEPRRHRIPRARHRVTNWPEYDRGLVGRGDLRLWIAEGALAAWAAPRRRTRGGQARFSDLAIEAVLMPASLFRLPLRQAEGFVRSLMALMGLALMAPPPFFLWCALAKRGPYGRGGRPGVIRGPAASRPAPGREGLEPSGPPAPAAAEKRGADPSETGQGRPERPGQRPAPPAGSALVQVAAERPRTGQGIPCAGNLPDGGWGSPSRPLMLRCSMAVVRGGRAVGERRLRCADRPAPGRFWRSGLFPGRLASLIDSTGPSGSARLFSTSIIPRGLAHGRSPPRNGAAQGERLRRQRGAADPGGAAADPGAIWRGTAATVPRYPAPCLLCIAA